MTFGDLVDLAQIRVPRLCFTHEIVFRLSLTSPHDQIPNLLINVSFRQISRPPVLDGVVLRKCPKCDKRKHLDHLWVHSARTSISAGIRSRSWYSSGNCPTLTSRDTWMFDKSIFHSWGLNAGIG